jgi:phosphatidylglycerophosphate synthase
MINALVFFRKFANEIFGPIARFLAKIRISANMMTVISLLMGLTAVYFAFVANYLYVWFVILHFFCDILDGEIARLTKPTIFGSWFDYFTDRSIILLLLVKAYFYANVPAGLYWAVICFFLIQHLVYILSARKTIIIYSRAVALLLFMSDYYTETFVVLLTINVFGFVLQMIDLLPKKGGTKR